MDPLTTSVVALLAPALGGLAKKGADAVAREIGSGIGADAWAQAKRVWEKLGPRVEETPGALELAQDLGSDPDNQDLRTAFGVQVEKILDRDAALADELRTIIIVDSGVDVKVTGPGAIGGGRDVSVGHVVNNFLGAMPGVSSSDLPKGRALAIMLGGFALVATGMGLFFVLFAVAVAMDSPRLLILMPAVFGLGFIGVCMVGGAAIYGRIQAEAKRDRGGVR